MGRWVMRGMLVQALVLGSGLPGWGNTRLGLHVTSDELAIWQQRMIDNVNGVNGYSFQNIYQQRILADANSFRSQSHPGGDGYWAGWTGSGCAPWESAAGRARGASLARSAFVFLLTGDRSYADQVRTELLNQIAQPGTNWANSSKWCVASPYVRAFEHVPWIMRLLLAYDYLNAGGYTGFSASEKQSIENWFVSAATFWHAIENAGYTQYSAYPGVFSEPQNLTPSADPYWRVPERKLYYNGPTLQRGTTVFMNQGTPAIMLNAAVGVLTNNPTFITYAKKAAKAWLTAGFWDDGSFTDFDRWRDCLSHTPSYECPGSMWGHAGGAYAGLTTAIDLIARTGDTSLYQLSVTNQTLGSAGSIMTWQKVLELWAKMANKTVQYYGTDDPSRLTPGRLLTWDSDVYNEAWAWQGNYYDFSSMMANLYYNNSHIHTAMTRNLKGSNSTSGCNDGQYGGCFSGVFAWWPDLPFMYGNMEGQVNPYNLTSSAMPTVSITTPTTYASITVSGATLTLSGPASDDVGVASVTWARTSPSGSGSATCTPSCGGGSPPTSTTWTITNLALPADGQSTTVTVTVSDGDDPVQTAQVVLTVTRQDTPDTTSNRLLWLLLNDGSGPTAADSSGQNPPNTGTLQGGAAWGTGHVGGGIVLDGVDDAISLTSALGTPAVLTIAAWVNLSAGTDDFATILNIGNRVGLRIDYPTGTRRPTTFWYDGANYPNFVSSTAFPGSGWHHVAMTMSAARQVLYLDGVVVAMGAGATPNYSGSTGTTMIGRHVAGTLWDLAGSLDDVRVYSRALSEVDLTSLVAGEGLSIVITEPTSAATYERTTEPLLTLSGSAYGTSVTVTWACVGCQTNPSGEATFTPPTWTVANIPLATGSSNVITVTATDGAFDTAQDTITVTYSPPQETVASPLRLRLAH